MVVYIYIFLLRYRRNFSSIAASIEKATVLARSTWSSSNCVNPYICDKTAMLQRLIGTATQQGYWGWSGCLIDMTAMFFVVEVACAGNRIHHHTGSCRQRPWKCYSLEDAEDLQKEEVWMTRYLVSFHSPRSQQIFFYLLPLIGSVLFA